MDKPSKVITEGIIEDDNQQEGEGNIQSKLSFEEAILSRLAYSSAVFKSQQKDEPELSVEEKNKIAFSLFNRSHAEFLSRFGKYLNNNLLEYFSTTDRDNYEVIHYVNKLKRYFDKTKREMDIKNRRYEALKTLIEKGEYFSEAAMIGRNPLLYDNLIGKYLTEAEKKARDSVNEKDNTLVNRLMKGIDKDETDELKKRQEDAENDAMEETDSDSESEENVDSDESDTQPLKYKDNKNLTPEENKNVGNKSSSQWGNIPKTNKEVEENKPTSSKVLTREYISSKEQKILKEEFMSYMYQSFLDGNDSEFDYSTVDDNEEYDNLDIKTYDEEEKYFDSESPEWAGSPKTQDKIQDDESEDELDKYMNSLKEQSHIDDDRLRNSSS